MNWIKNKLFLNQFRYYKILFVLKCSQCKYSTKNNVDRGVGSVDSGCLKLVLESGCYRFAAITPTMFTPSW